MGELDREGHFPHKKNHGAEGLERESDTEGKKCFLTLWEPSTQEKRDPEKKSPLG